jgi:hypothetical protein
MPSTKVPSIPRMACSFSSTLGPSGSEAYRLCIDPGSDRPQIEGEFHDLQVVSLSRRGALLFAAGRTDNVAMHQNMRLH